MLQCFQQLKSLPQALVMKMMMVMISANLLIIIYYKPRNTKPSLYQSHSSTESTQTDRQVSLLKCHR